MLSLTRVLRQVKSVPTAVAVRSVHKLPHLAYDVGSGVPPVWSAQSAKMHYDEYHRGVLKHLNYLLEGSVNETRPLEEVILVNRMGSENAAVFNTAAQCYNHNFVWLSVIPNGIPPSDWMLNQMSLHFGSYDRFKQLWKAHCKAVFGSGYVWLIDNDGQLEIAPSFNAGNPVGRRAITPLLVIDLWEHAYHTDYGTNREAYVDAWFEAVNWKFVEAMLRRVERSPHVTAPLGEGMTVPVTDVASPIGEH